jgi:hypothetical protein
MFKRKGLGGWALHKALHHQHERIYNFDPTSKHGRFESPCEEMTSQFLDMVHYDTGGRIFTYVITLDGLFRFTETGKQFGIDMLSKHSMHSDVHVSRFGTSGITALTSQAYIAWSGEFIVRRRERPGKSASDSKQVAHPPKSADDNESTDKPPTEPRFYELIIDNDSGTYRPEKSLLPVLQKFLENNLVGLQIVAMACDDEKLDKIKEAQVKVKDEEGDHMVIGQQSETSSISSSDEEVLQDRAGADGQYMGTVDKGIAALRDPKGTVDGALPGHSKRAKKRNKERAAAGGDQ